ncbi:unnamed protein product, partial [Vitis vinifera]
MISFNSISILSLGLGINLKSYMDLFKFVQGYTENISYKRISNTFTHKRLQLKAFCGEICANTSPIQSFVEVISEIIAGVCASKTQENIISTCLRDGRSRRRRGSKGACGSHCGFLSQNYKTVFRLGFSPRW